MRIKPHVVLGIITGLPRLTFREDGRIVGEVSCNFDGFRVGLYQKWLSDWDKEEDWTEKVSKTNEDKA